MATGPQQASCQQALHPMQQRHAAHLVQQGAGLQGSGSHCQGASALGQPHGQAHRAVVGQHGHRHQQGLPCEAVLSARDAARTEAGPWHRVPLGQHCC